MIALVFLLLSSQETPAVRQTYSQLCAGCHGEDARGTQQGPGLVGNLRTRRRNAAAIRTIITKGVPTAGMPAFTLPAATLDGLAALVVSLNAVAADVPVPGDVAAGQAYFFGGGKCSTCHLISGAGTALGPDLSAVGRTLTVEQLREALLAPSAKLAPGYGLVNIQFPNGRTLRGFARQRSAFDLAVQDLAGRLHPLSLAATAKRAPTTCPPRPRRLTELTRLPQPPAHPSAGPPIRRRRRHLPGLSPPRPRRLAHLQRQPQRQPLQLTYPNQHHQRK